jgi:hypothetical protein
MEAVRLPLLPLDFILCRQGFVRPSFGVKLVNPTVGLHDPTYAALGEVQVSR